MATCQDKLDARRRSSAGPEAEENTQMPAVTGSRTMLEHPDKKGWIEKRDRMKPTGKATSSTSAAQEVLHATRRDQKEEKTDDDEHMNEDGGPVDASSGVPELSPEDVEVGVGADEEQGVLYGPEA